MQFLRDSVHSDFKEISWQAESPPPLKNFAFSYEYFIFLSNMESAFTTKSYVFQWFCTNYPDLKTSRSYKTILDIC